MKPYTKVAREGKWGSSEKGYWCHGLYEYLPSVEEDLVGSGWGSSCGGICGNPNEQLQKVEIILTGDSPSPEYSPTPCDGMWEEEREKCACTFDQCWAMTSKGVC